MDQENDPDILAMNGASAALILSDIPFAGPIASVRVGRINGELKINPTLPEYESSDINIIVTGSKTGVVMVEGGGNIVSEADMLEAIFFGHQQMQPLIDMQLALCAEIGKPKRAFAPPPPDENLVARLGDSAYGRLREVLAIPEKTARTAALRNTKLEICESLGEDFAERKAEVSAVLEDIHRSVCRDMVLKEGRRIDNRKFDEIRPISCETGLLPGPTAAHSLPAAKPRFSGC